MTCDMEIKLYDMQMSYQFFPSNLQLWNIPINFNESKFTNSITHWIHLVYCDRERIDHYVCSFILFHMKEISKA